MGLKLLKCAIRQGKCTLPNRITAKTTKLFFGNKQAKAVQTFSASASEGAQKAEQSVLREHGLSEIMTESAHTPTKIGQTPVHSPLKPELPEHYIKVEGQIIPYEYDMKGNLAASYTITPAKEGEYIELFETRHFLVDGVMQHERVSIGPGKKVQFYNDAGYGLGAVIKIPRTSKMTKEEYIIAIENMKKKPKAQTVTPTEITETLLERRIKDLEIPKGTVSQRIALDDEGNTIVRFIGEKDNFIRKIKLSPEGHVLEYTNFETKLSNIGIGDAYLSRKESNCSFTCRVNNEIPIDQAPSFDEATSVYTRINKQSRYILDSNGNIARTIQTSKYTPHKCGQIKTGEQAVSTVDTRSMGDGKFVEDVTITKGDKRFSRSFWFDQKTGEVHQMDGWCKGLTKEELELIKSDPFLASRYYNDGLDFVRAEKFNAYKTQNLRDKQTPLTFKAPESALEAGHYQHSIFGHHINITPDFAVNGSRSRVVNTMHHEPRHGFQHQMTDDLNASLLKGEEKAQAEIFADNFAHYSRPEDNFWAYWEQPVEVDARRAGEAAEKLFEKNEEKINRIFFG